MKKLNLSQWLRGACAGILLGSGALIFTGCEATVSTPGPEAYYDYDYYPGVDVYYYPSGHVYYWNDGGRWRSGRELPPRIVIRNEHSESFHAHSRQPWTEHRAPAPQPHAGPRNGYDRDHDHY